MTPQYTAMYHNTARSAQYPAAYRIIPRYPAIHPNTAAYLALWLVGWLVLPFSPNIPKGGHRARSPLSERGESVTCPARNSPPSSAGQFADPPEGGVIPQTTAQAKMNGDHSAQWEEGG